MLQTLLRLQYLIRATRPVPSNTRMTYLLVVFSMYKQLQAVLEFRVHVTNQTRRS